MGDVKPDVHVCRVHCEGHFHVDAVREPAGFLDRDQFGLIAHYAEAYWYRGYRVVAVEPAGWLTPTITSEDVAIVFMEAHNPGTGVTKTTGPDAHPITTCLASDDLHESVTCQPASHYWPLHWSETGILLVLAGLLSATCFWWIRRRQN